MREATMVLDASQLLSVVRAATLDARFSIRALEREGGAMKGWIVGVTAVIAGVLSSKYPL